MARLKQRTSNVNTPICHLLGALWNRAIYTHLAKNGSKLSPNHLQTGNSGIWPKLAISHTPGIRKYRNRTVAATGPERRVIVMVVPSVLPINDLHLANDYELCANPFSETPVDLGGKNARRPVKFTSALLTRALSYAGARFRFA
jgi:hypothetical protein